jgi:hypothetical protein
MGFNHAICGYPSASAMAEAFGADQRWQVLGFYDFCKSNNLIDEVQNKQWNAFGEAYNGDGAVYGPKLKDAFNTKQALLALPTTLNPPIERLTKGGPSRKPHGLRQRTTAAAGLPSPAASDAVDRRVRSR